MNVSDLGEFALIERLRRALGEPVGEQLVAGIGDDAAVWRSAGRYAIATTDTMVAGVHFRADTGDWRGVGWKSLASNISDIAAMGGTPAYALVTLCLPGDTAVTSLDELYAGLRECAAEYGVTVAGGDTVSAPVLAVTVALTGVAAELPGGSPALLRRDAASAGDAVAVTGSLGGSAGGLRALAGGIARAGAAQRLSERHMRPRPRVSAGRAAVAAGVRCGIDVSDGLAQDLGHVCEASGLDAELWLHRLPVDADLVATYPEDALLMAATGGEDYELILVGPDDALKRAEAEAGTSLTIIGRMSAREAAKGVVRALNQRMQEVELGALGWDHFARSAR